MNGQSFYHIHGISIVSRVRDNPLTASYKDTYRLGYSGPDVMCFEALPPRKVRGSELCCLCKWRMTQTKYLGTSALIQIKRFCRAASRS